MTTRSFLLVLAACVGMLWIATTEFGGLLAGVAVFALIWFVATAMKLLGVSEWGSAVGMWSLAAIFVVVVLVVAGRGIYSFFAATHLPLEPIGPLRP